MTLTFAPPEQSPAETICDAPGRSVLGRIWSWAGTVLTCFAVLVGAGAIVVAVASHLSPPGEYTVFGHPVMSVLSGSMTPTIRTGDLVIDDPLTRTQAAHLHVGQIISFRQGTDVFTHRIHAIEHVDGSIAYQTKGDANNAPDVPLVVPGQIVGVYTAKVPMGGYVLYALHRPVTIALLLAAPALWLLSSWLYGMAKEAERDDSGSSASKETSTSTSPTERG